LDPNNPEALQCYCNFLISKQQNEEAAKYLKRSVEIWSKREDLPPFNFRCNTSKLLIELNLHKDAIPILERLLDEDNEFPENWYLLSLCHYDNLEVNFFILFFIFIF
jgi:predicted Zn-dependent protease